MEIYSFLRQFFDLRDNPLRPKSSYSTENIVYVKEYTWIKEIAAIYEIL